MIKYIFKNKFVTFKGEYLSIHSAFKITIDTTKSGSSSDTFILPTTGEGYDFTVFWGDGTFSKHSGTPGNITHVYSSPDTYQIRIRGTFPRIYFFGVGDCQKLMSIDQWGTIEWLSFQDAFRGCSNMVGNWTDKPNVVNCANYAAAFRDCSEFNSPLNWNICTNNGTNMFTNCVKFNQPVTSVNFSGATAMTAMFDGCSEFNQSVSHFNTSGIITMQSAFRNCPKFNQPVSNFDTSSVENFLRTFLGCTAFNQSVSNFNTEKVTVFSNMFEKCPAFKQSLANFKIRNNANMAAMLLDSNINETGTSTNYDNTLIAWANDPSTSTGRTFRGGNSKYGAGAGKTARDLLRLATGSGGFGWTINDGGQL
jgi:surface protein